MNDSKYEQLWEEIEQLREKLQDIAHRKGMRSSETIQASQRLDNKLNEYNCLIN